MGADAAEDSARSAEASKQMGKGDGVKRTGVFRRDGGQVAHWQSGTSSGGGKAIWRPFPPIARVFFF